MHSIVKSEAQILANSILYRVVLSVQYLLGDYCLVASSMLHCGNMKCMDHCTLCSYVFTIVMARDLISLICSTL